MYEKKKLEKVESKEYPGIRKWWFFLKHKLFNLEVVSCAWYLVRITELVFKLLALQPSNSKLLDSFEFDG